MELVLTAKAKILPTNEQALLLQDTLHATCSRVTSSHFKPLERVSGG